MRPLIVLAAFSFLFALLPGCNREYSDEGNAGKEQKTDSLPFDYPFATGFCDGVSLGISIVDTALYRPDTTTALPPSVLLDMPAAGNQGGQGSCAAWAAVYAVGTYYMHYTTGKAYSDAGNLSPKFTYNQITKGACRCTSILENLYLLKTQGACSLHAMPYDANECSNQPDSLQKEKAATYKIKDWQKVNVHNLAMVKRAVYEKKPVLFAIAVDAGVEHIKAPYIWKSRMGTTGQPHALVITGYDDTKNAFRFLNSWSTAWGDAGSAWIDYDFFLANVMEGGYTAI